MKTHLLFMISMLFASFTMQAQVNSVGLIGSATSLGWDGDTPMTKVNDSIYTFTGPLGNGEAKFRANGAWDVNWGDVAFPIGTGTQGGPNIPVFKGDYEVTFNANTGAYYFDVVSDIGIIGDATPGGWDNDTDLYIQDSVNYYTVINLKQGGAKFRANDAWTVNWGSAAFPSGVGVQEGDNIPIPAVGKYRVDFNKATGDYKFAEIVAYTAIGVIGSATPNGWDSDSPLTKDSGNPDLWKGTITLKGGELKFRANNAWTIDWGGGSFPSDTAVLKGSNIVVADSLAGDYLVSFDTKSLIYKFLKIGDFTTVGIIGDATPGGWDNGTPMEKDANDRSIWRLRVKLNAGEMKFRANNAWDVNWGGEGFPSGVGTQDGPNIPILAGEYKITLNSTTGEYNFDEVKEFGKISIVGKSGPFGEWPGADDSKDAYMTKDATDPNKWTATNITLTDHTGASDDGVKFRAEAAWAVNWGAKEFPGGIGTANGPNIECKAGVYNVAFRSDTGEYGFAPASSTYDLLDPAIINIVPNPASQYVNINITESVFKNDAVVKIMDNSGRLINKVSINPQGTSKVDVSSLNTGRYFMIITDGQSTVAKSVIIVD